MRKNVRNKPMWFNSSPNLIIEPTYLESGKLFCIEVSAKKRTTKGKGDNPFLKPEMKVK